MSSSRRLLLAGLIAGVPLFAPAAAAQQDTPSMQEATAAMQNGRFEEAAASFRQIIKAQPDNGNAWFNLGYSLHALGKLEEAHDWHIKAQDVPQVRPIAIYNHACVHALWGETDTAIKLLNDAVAEGFNNPDQLKGDPDMNNLRKDARFAALIKQLEGPAAKPAPAPPKPAKAPKAEAKKSYTAKAPKAKPAKPAKTAKAKYVAESQANLFDWYPGTWDVVADGQVVSRLEVKRLFDTNAYEVKSENSASIYRWDEDAGKWKQTWVGRDGLSAELIGGGKGGKIIMKLQGSFDDSGSLGRSVISNIGKNTVDYGWEVSNDGGKTWTVQQPLQFRRAGTKMKAEDAAHAAPAKKISARPAMAGYDFKLGTWNIEGKVKSADGSYVPCKGSAVAKRAKDGTIHEQITLAIKDGPTYHGKSVRRYDAEKDRWLVTWSLEEPEALSMDLIGKLKGDNMVEYGGDGEDATGTFSNRVTFLDVNDKQYSARQDRLYEDGRLEVGVWSYTAIRIG